MGKKNRGKGGRRDKYGDMFSYAGGNDDYDYEDSVSDDEYRYSYQEEIDSAEFIDADEAEAEDEEEQERGSYQNQNSRNDRYEVRSGRDLNESKEKAKSHLAEERDAWNFVQNQAAQNQTVQKNASQGSVSQGSASNVEKKSGASEKTDGNGSAEGEAAVSGSEANVPEEPKGPGAFAQMMAGLTAKVKSAGLSICEKSRSLFRKKDAADSEGTAAEKGASGETEAGDSGEKEKSQSAKSAGIGTVNAKKAEKLQNGKESASSGEKSAKKTADESETEADGTEEAVSKPKKNLVKELWTKTALVSKKTAEGFKNILKRKPKEESLSDEQEENAEAKAEESPSPKKGVSPAVKSPSDGGNVKQEGKTAEAQKETGKEAEEKQGFVPGIPSKTPEDLARENRRTYLILGGISVCMCLLLVAAGVLWFLSANSKTTAKNLENEQTGIEGELTVGTESDASKNSLVPGEAAETAASEELGGLEVPGISDGTELGLPAESEEKKEEPTEKEAGEEADGLTGLNFDSLGDASLDGADSPESEENLVPEETGGEKEISDSDTLAEILGVDAEKGGEVKADDSGTGIESPDSALADLSSESPQIQNAQIESGVEAGALDVNSQDDSAANLEIEAGKETVPAETDALDGLDMLGGETNAADLGIEAGTETGTEAKEETGISGVGAGIGETGEIGEIDAGIGEIDTGIDAAAETDSEKEAVLDSEKNSSLDSENQNSADGTANSSEPGELPASEDSEEVKPGLTLAPTKNTKPIPDEFQTPDGVTSGTNIEGWDAANDSAKPEAPQEEISWENAPQMEAGTDSNTEPNAESAPGSETSLDAGISPDTESAPGAETSPEAETPVESGLEDGLNLGEVSEDAISQLEVTEGEPAKEPAADGSSLDGIQDVLGEGTLPAETPAENLDGNASSDSLLAPPALSAEGLEGTDAAKNQESADPLAGLEALEAPGTDPLQNDTAAENSPAGELNAEESGETLDSDSGGLSDLGAPLDFSAAPESEPAKTDESEKTAEGADSLDSLGGLDALEVPAADSAPAAPSKNTQEISGANLADAKAGKAVPHKNYRVAEGDTYWSISEKFYGVPAYKEALARYNTDVVPDANNLKPGTVLLIPELDFLRSCFPTHCPQPEQIMHMPAAESGESRAVHFYVTAEGDTLSEVAERWLGDASRWPEIYRLNADKITDMNGIPEGIKLQIPAANPHPEPNIWK